MECCKHWHIESMNSWVGFVCNPEEPERSVERQLHPPAPSHNFPDPLKNGVLHQDWTSFFCSVVWDAASLLLEQPPAKAGAEINRAAQSKAEMRNIACFTRECIVAGNLSSLRLPPWKALKEVVSLCSASARLIHALQSLHGDEWPAALGTQKPRLPMTLRVLILKALVASPFSSGTRSSSRRASLMVLICWGDGTQSNSFGLVLKSWIISPIEALQNTQSGLNTHQGSVDHSWSLLSLRHTPEAAPEDHPLQKVRSTMDVIKSATDKRSWDFDQCKKIIYLYLIKKPNRSKKKPFQSPYLMQMINERGAWQ